MEAMADLEKKDGGGGTMGESLFREVYRERMRVIHELSVDYPFKMASCKRQQRSQWYLAEAVLQRKVLFLFV